MAAAPNPKGQAWFCSTGLPSDVVVDVDDMTFHLHKFPLMAKSKRLHELISEQEANLASNTAENEAKIAVEEEERSCHVKFPDFPGGPKTFEAAAKFCYALKIELTSSNVAPLRCAGEVLEMTEDYCEDNLVSKTETFLSQTVLRSLTDSIETLKSLKSCERLMSVAENVGIVERCIDSVLAKVSEMDPALFGWPVNEPLALAPATGQPNRAMIGGELWTEELTFLSPQLFMRLITAMKSQNLNNEIIENCLLRYAKKHIPGINRATRKPQSSNKHSEIDQKELLMAVVTHLPKQTYSKSTFAVKILFGMLRTANILNATDECKATLEAKIGAQFEHATLDDLLMPSYSYLSETLYDVECVQRILAQFLDNVEDRRAALQLVGKLIDGYLSEIALDANLKPEKFCELAVALPEQARVYDDSLYRSVDVYIKAHPWISEANRERVSGVLDCRKLTLEACTHAAHNERLPLRAVVQVLFFEQLQLRQAITGTLMAADMGQSEDLERSPGGRQETVELDEETVVEVPNEEDNVTWRAAVRENQVLRVGMDSMRTRVHELERECTTMKKAIEKIDKVGQSGWLTKRFGCASKTQVCVSHKATVVETRRGRARRTHNKSS